MSDDEEDDDESSFEDLEEDPEESVSSVNSTEKEREKQLAIQNDIELILDIRKYVTVTRRRITETIFGGAQDPEVSPTERQYRNNGGITKQIKSPSKNVTSDNAAYSVDGNSDLVDQAMKILLGRQGEQQMSGTNSLRDSSPLGHDCENAKYNSIGIGDEVESDESK